MSERKVVVLRSSDGTDLEVEEEVARMSMAIRRRILSGCDRVIELSVSSAALSKVVEYCKTHAAAASSSSSPSAPAPACVSALKDWDSDFINNIGDNTLSQIISASDDLDIRGLLLLSLNKKTLTLRCGDHHSFDVEGHIALKLKVIRAMLKVQPKCANNPIILPNVTAGVLSAVLEFYRKHNWAEATGLNEVKVNEMNQEFLKLYTRRSFDLIRCASYLEAESLLNLLVNSVKAVSRLADLASDIIVAEVVQGSYTKEEEDAMVAELANLVA